VTRSWWPTLGILLIASSAFAQLTGTLSVTVVDPSGAVVPGATVTVAVVDNAGAAPAIPPAISGPNGLATIPNLAPGRYAVKAEFPGFDTSELKDVRIRVGDNKQVAILPLPKLETDVTVAQDKQEAATTRPQTFGTVLTRDQIEALSDDPAVLRQQLQDMAGPGAVLKIDGFAGGALPAKAMIRSIRISRDQFAAENHAAGGVFIEIITQPGIGPVRYQTTLRVRDGELSGRSPFVPIKGAEASTVFSLNLGGGLIADRSSFALSIDGLNAYETPNLNAATLGGTQSFALGVKAPRNNLVVNGQLDYALTLDQTLRIAYNLTRVTADNLGVGGFVEPDGAYSTANTVHNVRIQHFGPLGRRAVTRTRVMFFSNEATASAALEAPTAQVLDAFTSGGAQVSGGDRSRTIQVASDFDYVLGRHSLRLGLLLDGGSYRSDRNANYLGTYTFDSLQAYVAGRPSNFTRRIGDPSVAYVNVQSGVYVQDDIRLRKNLTLSPGLRYEAQTHVRDYGNIDPRFGVTWAPFTSGVTTVRGSVGLFHDWLATAAYQQVLQVDGVRQRELNLVNPTYPDPGDVGLVPAANRYVLSPDFALPRTARVSAGVEQAIGKLIRVGATYSYQRGSDLSRGLNLNAPVRGARPDPVFANVIEAMSDAASRQHQVQVDANINPGALFPDFNGPRIRLRRTTVFINYTLATLRNNTDGPFSIPPGGVLADEWGPAANDVRSRLNLTVNNQIVRNLLVGFNLNTASAPAYTLLSGHDDNGDGVFNDRPSGTGRNALRADGQTLISAQVAYQFAFGTTAPLPPGIRVLGGGGATQVRTFDPGTARVQLRIFVQAENLTNQTNYLGYSGVLTSPFFGRPTAVSGMRKIDAGITLRF
jgi:Carboxypeptidase regulatory-like domain